MPVTKRRAKSKKRASVKSPRATTKRNTSRSKKNASRKVVRNSNNRVTKAYKGEEKSEENANDTIKFSAPRKDLEIPIFIAVTTYFGYAILTLFGKIRDFFASLTGTGRYYGKSRKDGVAPLIHKSENFYDRRMYHRIQDVFNRPITGPPGAGKMKVLRHCLFEHPHVLRCLDCVG